ncbi:MAG: rhombosortase [Opitutaceae bacterium]|nr:rhombosortase [Opitutaceae bacterium]
MSSLVRRFPWITASLSALTLAAWLMPGASAALQFDRTAIAHGSWWQLLSGHFTHWTPSHLGWDLAAFALLGTILERRSRAGLVTTLAAGAIAISAAVWTLAPELATYRGLSGIDSALFVACVSLLVAEAARERRPASAAWILLGAIAFVAKTVVESMTTTTFFVAPDASFVPVPLAHAAGAAAGLLCALTRQRLTRAAALTRVRSIRRRSMETAAPWSHSRPTAAQPVPRPPLGAG